MIKKTSFLQKATINRINKFCGIENLVSFLKRLQNNKSPTDKLRILTIQHYYQSLYLYYVQVEDDCIDYRNTILDTVAFLENHKNSRDSDYVCFLIDIINDSLNYTKKIKKLG